MQPMRKFETIHMHQCPRCGHVWAHENNCNSLATLCAFNDAHRCPKCTTTQVAKYHGFQPFEFRSCWTQEGA